MVSGSPGPGITYVPAVQDLHKALKEDRHALDSLGKLREKLVQQASVDAYALKQDK